MKIDKLIKYCLQYLEQGSETNVMNLSIAELLDDDSFSEYIVNIESSLFMGLTRYSSSNLLPIRIYDLDKGVYSVNLVEQNNGMTKPLAHSIKEVFATDSKGNIVPNIEYYVIGNNVRIKRPNSSYTYSVIYYPAIHDLEFYLEDSDSTIYDIELNNLGVTDEMAINLKYFIYSDMKLEENPNVANINKNYFETYLASLERTQVVNNQIDLVNRTNYDCYSDDAVTYSQEWRDIYGD